MLIFTCKASPICLLFWTPEAAFYLIALACKVRVQPIAFHIMGTKESGEQDVQLWNLLWVFGLFSTEVFLRAEYILSIFENNLNRLQQLTSAVLLNLGKLVCVLSCSLESYLPLIFLEYSVHMIRMFAWHLSPL